MSVIWGVVLTGAIGAFAVLVAVRVGTRQEAERLTGRAPTRLAAVARRVTGLHVITPQLPQYCETSSPSAGMRSRGGERTAPVYAWGYRPHQPSKASRSRQ
jgi:hypothetical protein